jgi:DUF3108-like
MNRSRMLTARSAGLAGVAAVAALALAGCGGGSPGSGSGGSPGSGSGGSGGTNASAGGATASSSSTPGSSGATTVASYYPLGAGNTWVYSMQGFGGKGTVTDKMLSVTSSSAGQVVTLADTTSYPLRKTIKETLIFRPDGSIQVPMSQFGAGVSVTLVSGQIVWPSAAQLAAGQSFKDTIVMKLDDQGHHETLRMPVTVVGQGTASVTVPAGTYQASVINETMATSMDGYKVSVAVRTWVANGVGPVKSEVFSGMLGGSGSSPASTEVLESFTKG